MVDSHNKPNRRTKIQIRAIIFVPYERVVWLWTLEAKSSRTVSPLQARLETKSIIIIIIARRVIDQTQMCANDADRELYAKAKAKDIKQNMHPSYSFWLATQKSRTPLGASCGARARQLKASRLSEIMVTFVRSICRSKQICHFDVCKRASGDECNTNYALQYIAPSFSESRSSNSRFCVYPTLETNSSGFRICDANTTLSLSLTFSLSPNVKTLILT